MNYGLFLQLSVVGLSMGMIYALLAVGVVLLVRAVGVMNFAQGELLTVGAYIGFALTYQLHLPLYGTILMSLIFLAMFGALFMFSVYWPLRKSTWGATVIISTLGASLVIKELVKIIWGNVPLVSDKLISGVLVIGKARLEYQYLLIIGVGAVLFLGIHILFSKLYVGRLMQAAAQDKYCAQLLGIPTILTTLVTYIISTAICGIGGFLVAPLFLVSTSLGGFLLKGFAGMVIGGFGSVKGAVLGSLLIGIIEAFSTLFTTKYNDAVVFLVLLLVLAIRPRGFFGPLISEKA